MDRRRSRGARLRNPVHYAHGRCETFGRIIMGGFAGVRPFGNARIHRGAGAGPISGCGNTETLLAAGRLAQAFSRGRALGACQPARLPALLERTLANASVSPTRSQPLMDVVRKFATAGELCRKRFVSYLDLLCGAVSTCTAWVWFDFRVSTEVTLRWLAPSRT